MSTIPWSHSERPDTKMSNVRLGMWVFLASETMLFGALFSAYVLLRTGAPDWPGASVLDLRRALMMTPVLLAATLVFQYRRARSDQARLAGSAILFSGFIGLKLLDYQQKIEAGLLPSTNVLLACWYTITAVHALHVAGGVVANLWVMMGLGRSAERDRERFAALRLYWYFVDLVWLVILVSFYLV
jgi:heme/copper-type cytochrome/quinol oxidase subunit 3